jgi:hypothetical protein
MSDIGLDLSPLFAGVTIALAATVFGTPLLWWLSGGVVPLWRRLLLVMLGNVGLAGLGALLALFNSNKSETPLFAVLAAAALQPLAVLVLLLVRTLMRKS